MDVPPWNLRRFVRTIQQTVNSTQSAVVNEIPGQPHWWGGVVDDDYMQAFIETHLYGGLPAVPDAFTVVALGLWGEGRGGIRVLQAILPYQKSVIQVASDLSTGTLALLLSCSNVRRFGIMDVFAKLMPGVKELTIDGTSLPVVFISSGAVSRALMTFLH